jgi:hypothetical protein
VSLAYNPYGLIPTAHESGIVRPAFGSGGAQPYGGYTIASGYASNIFQGSPIQIDSQTGGGAGTSNLILAPALGASVATPTALNKILGSFQGVEFTLATGRRTVSNFWPAGTVPFTNSQTVAWITRDPRIRYEIQANGSVPATAMGNLASITANGTTNGNTTTGLSTVGLDVTTANSLTTGTSANLNQLRIVGFSQRIDNLPGDAFTQVVVEIALHQDLPLPGQAY